MPIRTTRKTSPSLTNMIPRICHRYRGVNPVAFDASSAIWYGFRSLVVAIIANSDTTQHIHYDTQVSAYNTKRTIPLKFRFDQLTASGLE